MNPDKLDIRIQEAAAQNEPAYTEEAWSAMEKLLDEKMPQKKKEKKRIFWLFLFLFIVAGGALLLVWPERNNTNKIASAKTNTAEIPTGAKNNILTDQKDTAGKRISRDPVALPINQGSANKKIHFPQTGINSGLQVTTNNKPEDNDDEVPFLAEKKKEDKNSSFRQEQNSTVSKESINNDEELSNTGLGHKDSVTENKDHTADTGDRSAIKENDHDASLKETPAPERKFAHSFAINFSFGPDVSVMNLENIGKLQAVYGAGISYRINKKFTVRTGFYVERKIYDASPSAYNPPSGFWNYYPDLKYIDANCKLYEVPLLINYNFSQSPDHQWFASVGLSSYFMKKEDYTYFSKTSSGQSWYDNYEVRNKNRHYFSSLRIAAGYEKNLGGNISVIAEPYMNLPLSGVGYGKVKLGSAGILFSLSVKPFSKR